MSEQQSPSLTEMIEWCHEDLSWKEHHGWPDDDLLKQRTVLARLKRLEKLEAVQATARIHGVSIRTPRRTPASRLLAEGAQPTAEDVERARAIFRDLFGAASGVLPVITARPIEPGSFGGSLMTTDFFARPVAAALAAGRREALEQAANIAVYGPGARAYGSGPGYEVGRVDAAAAIRALIAAPAPRADKRMGNPGDAP